MPQSMNTTPEHFARALIEFLDVDLPFEFADIAGDLGLRLRQVPSTGFDGALLRVAGSPQGIIVVRESIPETGSKRFTIAHEIGHYILPGHETDCSVCTERDVRLSRKNADRLEQEANKFAAELLLPAAKLSTIVRERGLSLKTGKFVSKLFQTSLTVAAIRCVEVSERKAAFIESRNGVVRLFAKSRSWKGHIDWGGEIGSGALARQLSVGGEMEKEGRVQPMEWIWGQTGATLMEESMLMPSYNSVLSLLTFD